MKKTLVLFFLLLTGAVVSFGQQKQPLTAQAASPCSTTGPTCLIATGDPNYGGATFTLSGTFSATVTFYGSGDGGASWQTIDVTPSNSSTQTTTATAPGIFQYNISGYTNLQILVTAYTSGTVIASIVPSHASAPGNSGGAGGGGSFADNSAFTVGTTSISPIGAYYTSGAAPALSTGDAARVRMDANSYLFTDCVVGCSGGATTPSDAFANPTTAGLSFSFLAGYNGTTWDRLRDDTNKYLYVDVGTALPAGGNDIGYVNEAGTWSVNAFISNGLSVNNWAGDVLGAMANYGTSPGAVLVPGVNAYVTNTVPVTGTFWQATQPVSGTFWQTTQPVSGTFWQATQPVSIASMPSTPVTGTFWQTTQPVSCTAANCKVDVNGNAGAAFDQAPGSAAPANAIQVGGTDGTNTRVSYMDPCAFNAWTYYVVNVSANTQIVAGSASKNVYICKEFLQPVAAAANVELVESATSGNACATSPTGMMGGNTAALGGNLAVNGGFVLPADGRAWAKTATTADAVCIFASAQVTGVIAYVQF